MAVQSKKIFAVLWAVARLGGWLTDRQNWAVRQTVSQSPTWSSSSVPSIKPYISSSFSSFSSSSSPSPSSSSSSAAFTIILCGYQAVQRQQQPQKQSKPSQALKGREREDTFVQLHCLFLSLSICQCRSNDAQWHRQAENSRPTLCARAVLCCVWLQLSD